MIKPENSAKKQYLEADKDNRGRARKVKITGFPEQVEAVIAANRHLKSPVKGWLISAHPDDRVTEEQLEWQAELASAIFHAGRPVEQFARDGYHHYKEVKTSTDENYWVPHYHVRTSQVDPRPGQFVPLYYDKVDRWIKEPLEMVIDRTLGFTNPADPEYRAGKGAREELAYRVDSRSARQEIYRAVDESIQAGTVNDQRDVVEIIKGLGYEVVKTENIPSKDKRWKTYRPDPDLVSLLDDEDYPDTGNEEGSGSEEPEEEGVEVPEPDVKYGLPSGLWIKGGKLEKPIFLTKTVFRADFDLRAAKEQVAAEAANPELKKAREQKELEDALVVLKRGYEYKVKKAHQIFKDAKVHKKPKSKTSELETKETHERTEPTPGGQESEPTIDFGVIEAIIANAPKPMVAAPRPTNPELTGELGADAGLYPGILPAESGPSSEGGSSSDDFTVQTKACGAELADLRLQGSVIATQINDIRSGKYKSEFAGERLAELLAEYELNPGRVGGRKKGGRGASKENEALRTYTLTDEGLGFLLRDKVCDELLKTTLEDKRGPLIEAWRNDKTFPPESFLAYVDRVSAETYPTPKSKEVAEEIIRGVYRKLKKRMAKGESKIAAQDVVKVADPKPPKKRTVWEIWGLEKAIAQKTVDYWRQNPVFHDPNVPHLEKVNEFSNVVKAVCIDLRLSEKDYWRAAGFDEVQRRAEKIHGATRAQSINLAIMNDLLYDSSDPRNLEKGRRISKPIMKDTYSPELQGLFIFLKSAPDSKEVARKREDRKGKKKDRTPEDELKTFFPFLSEHPEKLVKDKSWEKLVQDKEATGPRLLVEDWEISPRTIGDFGKLWYGDVQMVMERLERKEADNPEEGAMRDLKLSYRDGKRAERFEAIVNKTLQGDLAANNEEAHYIAGVMDGLRESSKLKDRALALRMDEEVDRPRGSAQPEASRKDFCSFWKSLAWDIPVEIKEEADRNAKSKFKTSRKEVNELVKLERAEERKREAKAEKGKAATAEPVVPKSLEELNATDALSMYLDFFIRSRTVDKVKKTQAQARAKRLVSVCEDSLETFLKMGPVDLCRGARKDKKKLVGFISRFSKWLDGRASLPEVKEWMSDDWYDQLSDLEKDVKKASGKEMGS